jgi:hypothetical protein
MNRREYRPSRVKLALALIATLASTACSTYRRYEESRPENIRQTEATLSEAGFAVVKIDTADQAGLASNLPPHEQRKYDVESGTVYWYYDPNLCACVYEGHQEAYDRYEMALLQQKDTAQYVEESQAREVASLNALNGGMFPPPTLLWLGAISGGLSGGGDRDGGGGVHHGGGGGGHGGGHGGGGHGHR